jgi:hypothetical protein
MCSFYTIKRQNPDGTVTEYPVWMEPEFFVFDLTGEPVVKGTKLRDSNGYFAKFDSVAHFNQDGGVSKVYVERIDADGDLVRTETFANLFGLTIVPNPEYSKDHHVGHAHALA